MKTFKRTILLSITLQLFFICTTIAQPKKQLIDIQVTPTHTDWNYNLGETASFNVNVLKNGKLVPNTKIYYEIGLERMPAILKGDLLLKKGSTKIKGIKLKTPGLVRCTITVEYNGKKYSKWGTAGFATEKIKPTVKMPDNFDEFWEIAKKELSEIPIDAIVTLKPELCTATINVYHVSLQNIKMPLSWRGTSRFYGMLSVPKKPGKYPAILGVPGAGVRGYGRDDRAAKDVIVFKVGIHGIPLDMDEKVYKSLATGSLAGYERYNLRSKDDYYYKRVYMGCVRAVDFIHTLPEFDGENLAVTGGSQGGALSIVTAGLDSRIKYLVAFYPALSDLTGYLHGRAGGWPHMYQDYDKKKNPNWLATTAYYDVVNFAKKLNVPGWYSWGYNDHICPPTSMFSAYNSITAPKELHPFVETEHWTYPEQWEEANTWLLEKFKTNR